MINAKRLVRGFDMKRQGLLLTCAVLLAVQAGSESQAAGPNLEDVHRDLAILAWRIQFHYVWTGEYPEALDRVLKGKPKGEKQTLESDDVVDPFSPLKLPYGYILAEDGKTFLLYSVGPDGLDEQGKHVYPFWPSSRFSSAFEWRGPGTALRGDLVIDSRELAKHVLAEEKADLPVSSPLLSEYLGAKDLAWVTREFAEWLNEELTELNTPSVLESGRETYLETFRRFCGEHQIRVVAVAPSDPDSGFRTDGNDVDDALARVHAPIPRKAGGRYELLEALARACGLHIISLKAYLRERTDLRVIAEPPADGEGEAVFVLVLKPYWSRLGDADRWVPVSWLLTNPDQIRRLGEVCGDLGYVLRDDILRVFRPWFVAVLGEVAGFPPTDEEGALGD